MIEKRMCQFCGSEECEGISYNPRAALFLALGRRDGELRRLANGEPGRLATGELEQLEAKIARLVEEVGPESHREIAESLRMIRELRTNPKFRYRRRPGFVRMARAMLEGIGAQRLGTVPC